MNFLFIILTFSSLVQAYTLNNNFGASFNDNNVKVTVDVQTTCADAGMTVYELQDLIKPSINDFWNRVPTSALRLKAGGFSGPHTNINVGRLCAPTDESCITTGPNVIAPVTDIVIACNNLAINFSSLNVLAVTIPNNFSGKKIKGAVILINNQPNSAFANLSKKDKIGVLAHEIGHAIGLGHTDETAALMYYRTVNLRKALGEDDMMGVSYLYPMHVDGCGLLGGIGSITSNDGTPPKNPPFWQMGATLALVIMLTEIMKLLKRSKTRSTT